MKRVYNIPSSDIISVQSLSVICDFSGEVWPGQAPGSPEGGANAAPRW